MQLDFITLDNQKDLIDGVKLHKLIVNKDPRGSLTEIAKMNWGQLYNDKLPFAQTYCSITMPSYARDEDKLHFHPTQWDRFVVMKGNAVFALFDPRENSPTKGILNLFLMGEENGNEGQYALLIPKEVFHGFACVGNEPIYLLGFPTLLYNPEEEGRITFEQGNIRFSDGDLFSWERVRKELVI